MCGIAGEISFAAPVSERGVPDMVAGIRHRGPDDEGVWQDAAARVKLGHARLSIIDLSPLGHQPMIDPQTGNVLVFNGEIYNFQELRRQCEAAGDSFCSRTDTEVILALYRRHGEGCVRQLRGMFAFALWDAARQRLVLARDRVGKKPLNYALTGKGLVFCSELAPLAAHPAISTERDDDALALYLQLQSVPAPWTIYRQIRKLPPAHIAVFDADGFRTERYWNVAYRPTLKLSDAEMLEAFEERLTDAVRQRMISDVPLGALLSGGVDSSVVVAVMARLSGAPVRTFSIGFGEQEFNELPFAGQAAEICGTLHHPEVVTGDVEAMLPQIALHYGEPYADSSAIPSFLVSEVARQHVTVVLNGDGGDELLGGYGRYGASDFAIRNGAAVGHWLGARRLVDLIPFWENASSVPGRALRRVIREAISPEIGGLLMFTGYWNDALRNQLMGGEGRTPLVQSWRHRWMGEAFEQAGNPIDRMLWLDNRTYLPDDLLVKMDIAAMHCGLEARSPLLDHELIEFCATLPVNMKVRGRTTKYLLKRLAEKYFPREFVHRPKMGFAIPVAEWLRGPLRRRVEENLFDAKLMEPLDGAAIRASWARLNGGTGALATAEAGRVWALMMYAEWRRLAC